MYVLIIIKKWCQLTLTQSASVGLCWMSFDAFCVQNDIEVNYSPTVKHVDPEEDPHLIMHSREAGPCPKGEPAGQSG